MTENDANIESPQTNTTEQSNTTENKPLDPRAEAIKTEIVELLLKQEGIDVNRKNIIKQSIHSILI